MSRHQQFWDKEYKTGEHLALSTRPSEDLEKFTRWLERNFGKKYLNQLTNVLDLGCGNGRNLIFLAKNFGIHGTGYDISTEAIKQAKGASKDLPLHFSARSITGKIEAADNSFDVILDMMSSHFLKEEEREAMHAEVLRVLKPDGWLFFKSFLAEGDLHVKRLLRDNPADEKNAYIHPKLGVYEYVWTEETLKDFFEPHFYIHKIEKSHKHIIHGRAGKRRTISAFLQKN